MIFKAMLALVGTLQVTMHLLAGELGDGMSEKEALEKWGRPTRSREVGGGVWQYYLGLRGRPDLIVKCKEGKVAELKWSFPKLPLVAHADQLMVLAPNPESVLSVTKDFRVWLEEVEIQVRWKDLAKRDRAFALNSILEAARQFGVESALLEFKHPLLDFITNGKPDAFGAVIVKGGVRRVDLLQLIRDNRDLLTNNPE